jgi:hypothetical protein
MMLRLLRTTVVVGLIVTLGLVATSGAPAAEPAIKISDVTVEATSPSGAPATFHVKAFDPDTDNPISVTCSPAGSGTGDFTVTTTFPLDTTTVSCDGADDDSNPVHGEASVTVQDTTAPTLPQPGNLTASSPTTAGIAVSWPDVTGTDIVDGSITANCSPASGTVFLPGPTTVTCTATDNHGNSAQVQFTVTVTFADTEPPSLTVPADISVNTSGTSAVVTYSVSASDNSGNPPAVSCNPPSGSTFPVGTTTVNCTASDGVNPPTTASFTVTVTFVDTTAPAISNVPANRVVEANGPSGSVVSYTGPTATDAAEGPKPVSCSPTSGSTFPLGGTTVNCTASDSHGNTSSASFAVTVVDTTKPNLIVPVDRTVYADTPSGIDHEGYGVPSFLNGASATDTVDPSPRVGNDAPEFLAVGVHTVTFRATDFSGNTTLKSAVIEVLPMPPAGTTPLPIPPARTAPPDVLNLKAEAGDRRVRLSWQAPAGVDHVVISRSLSLGGDAQVVYTGSAESFLDRAVVNTLEYRYVVVSVGKDGLASAGVAATARPRPTLLKAPKDGARLRKAPKLSWVANSEANYYNVQLFRGEKKILSIWPVKPALKLKNKWKYQGHTYKLSGGVYRWYVWPGFGARKAVDYGEMLGFSTFQIVR